MEYKLKEELVFNDIFKKFDIDINYLFDERRIESRSRTIDVLYSFNEEENEVYFYDLLAYLFRYSGNMNVENYDEYIWNLLKKLKNDDHVSFNSVEFYEFINYANNFSISSVLRTFLYNMYIYNETIIQNNHLIDSPIYKLNNNQINELYNYNLSLYQEQENLKEELLFSNYDDFLENYYSNSKKKTRC